MTRRVPTWPLGWRLKRALIEGKVSRTRMAAHLGVDEATISRWMKVESRLPVEFSPKTGVHYLTAWADLTGVPVEWLLTGASPVDEAEDELLIADQMHHDEDNRDNGDSVTRSSPKTR